MSEGPGRDPDTARPEDVLVVPAWHDPKGRTKFVWDATTIRVGLLALDRRSLFYATGDGVQFSGSLDSVKVEWRSFAKWISGCWLTVNGESNLMYFARPLPAAPRATKTTLNSIADKLSSPAIQLGGLVWSGLGMLDLAGNLLAIPGEFSDQKQGIRNGEAVKAWLEEFGQH
ncbi:hypothetical protein GCM10009712_08350 [Pseudarthrobacter sulfonivorans]